MMEPDPTPHLEEPMPTTLAHPLFLMEGLYPDSTYRAHCPQPSCPRILGLPGSYSEAMLDATHHNLVAHRVDACGTPEAHEYARYAVLDHLALGILGTDPHVCSDAAIAGGCCHRCEGWSDALEGVVDALDPYRATDFDGNATVLVDLGLLVLDLAGALKLEHRAAMAAAQPPGTSPF